MAKKENIASVLAFEKKLVPSDGRMYGTTWEERTNNDKSVALHLNEKSVRGTISNRLKKPLQEDPLKLDAEVQKANLQTVDNCALSNYHDTLRLNFTLKILSGVEYPAACNNPSFNASCTAAVKKYLEQDSCKELAKRYAINIANARCLWRNRVGAEEIEVIIRTLNQVRENSWKFNAKSISLQNFNYTNSEIGPLAEEIEKALSGKQDFLLLDVNVYAKIGSAQEVYPSEELVLVKSSDKNQKSKILYKVGEDEIAAIHSQKIGNALRCIDTWYPEPEGGSIGPIAVEPYGAVTTLGKAFRHPKTGKDFYTLFDVFARGDTLANKDDEHYVVAVLVRGGVFGESSKDE